MKNNTDKFEIPDLTRSTGLVFVRGTWYCRYWLGGREKRKSLGTANRALAEMAQLMFYRDAPIYRGKSIKDKLKTNPDLYLYKRPEWVFQIAGKIAVPCNTREEAERERDKYLAKLCVKPKR